MALTDYNKEKTVEVTSQNDSGATVSKAQPIICVDGDDSTTGTGDVVIDFANISDAQDIAVYDNNDNLLDYEIEELDTTNSTAVLWVYNDWTRDDSAQLKVAYGSNSANTDRQNVTGTWGNTGQNMDMVQHFQDSPLSATDSTSNNNDLTVNGPTAESSQFDGGANFDGTDDDMEGPNDIVDTSTWTASFWLDSDTANNGDTNRWFIHQYNSSNSNQNSLFIGTDAFTNGNFAYQGGSIATTNLFDEDKIRGQGWVQVTVTFDDGTVTAYVDGVQEAQVTSQSNWGTGSYPLQVGNRGDGNLYYDGGMDELKLTEDVKSQTWAQAEYDASPKAGQVFFSQQSAETTATATEKSVTGTFDAAIESLDNSLTATVDTVTQHRQNGNVQLDGSNVQGAEVHVYNVTQQTNIGHDQTDSNGDYSIDPVNVADIVSGDKLMIATYYEDGSGNDFGDIKVTVV